MNASHVELPLPGFGKSYTLFETTHSSTLLYTVLFSLPLVPAKSGLEKKKKNTKVSLVPLMVHYLIHVVHVEGVKVIHAVHIKYGLDEIILFLLHIKADTSQFHLSFIRCER